MLLHSHIRLRFNYHLQIFRKRELAGIILVIQGSARFDDGLTLFFEGLSDDQSLSADGILGKKTDPHHE